MTYNVFLRGEDHTEFTIGLDAETEQEAREIAQDHYPEATVLEVFDPVQRADEIYYRACRRMDDEDVYYD